MNNSLVYWRFDYKYLVFVAISIILLVDTFWEGIDQLIVRWNKQEEYSHGFMIPFVVLYFIWLKRDVLKKTEFKPSWFGVLLVMVSLVIFLVGEVSALYILIHYSLIAVLIGLAWSVMGWRALKVVLMPLLLLVFAIPLPYFLEASLTANLQLLSSRLGVSFIRWCEIPVFLDGNLIDLGDYKLQVVEACSGLRYLFPLMSFGFICAYIYQVSFWKRAFIFLSTIPITLLMNSFRIGVTGILVNIWGIEVAEGFMHDFEGWFIFMACLAILFAEMFILARIGKDRRPLSEVFGLHVSTILAKPSEVAIRKVSLPFVGSIICLLISFIFVHTMDKRNEFIPERESFLIFPEQIGEWKGKQHSMEKSTIKFLGFSDYILADYVNDQGDVVNFYVAYYETQRKGVSPHSPRVCIPGGGWSIASIERDVFSNGLPFNRILIKKGEHKQLVYYWFQERGRIFANEYLMKWHLFKDAVLKNRTDGALVRITTPVLPKDKLGDTDRRLRGFASQIRPLLHKYIPN